MELSSFLKTKMGKITFSFAVVLAIITLFKYGYKFGQWLQLTLN